MLRCGLAARCRNRTWADDKKRATRPERARSCWQDGNAPRFGPVRPAVAGTAGARGWQPAGRVIHYALVRGAQYAGWARVHGYFDGLGRFAEPWLLVLTSLADGPKLLARRGQFAAARQLAEEAQALIAPTPARCSRPRCGWPKAEVNRLAGDGGQAAADLRAALRILEDRREVPLAKQVKAALASLVPHPSKPA
jgi:hypothetical protein